MYQGHVTAILPLYCGLSCRVGPWVTDSAVIYLHACNTYVVRTSPRAGNELGIVANELRANEYVQYKYVLCVYSCCL